ncbi:amidohydrolase [uncultured Christiangramia sp.]|uniref:amidohydrolase n=1 Tax=uncultured Christiangramia sp. TaxID=503836 RepID=UPI0026358F73|nr:amidohydrolase [uncultured Christiangramia sp.]
MKHIITLSIFLATLGLQAQQNVPEDDFQNIEDKVIDWRRDLHENPELSNREFETAKKIAAHLESLGIETTTEIAKTGVVGILKGDKPGKTLALRADIDALPVKEKNDLEFKSTKTTEFLGSQTGVMHACGHDTHTAILMGVAEILSKHKDKINGTVKFIFQPAEEGPPPGEEGGAALMIKEGVLENPDVDAIFGLHINAATPVGTIKYKSEGTMAAVERFVINVQGKQAHGSAPWSGVDPILISAKIIDGLQTIISRNADLTESASVITVGKITSGVRFNIIPETAELIGTVRTLDPENKKVILSRMRELVPAIAQAYGGSATIDIQNNTAITFNDVALTQQMLPTLENVAGKENVNLMKATTGGEDFSFFQEKVPGFYFFLGGRPENAEPTRHHTPDFYIDESGLLLGVKTMTQLTLDFLSNS